MKLQLAEAGLSKGISFKKIGKGVKKVALAGPRNAFLALIKLNVHNFARRLQKNIEAGKGSQIFGKWEKMGGKKSALEKAISTGAKKKPLLDSAETLGADPGTASFMVQASAVLVALRDFLRKTGEAIDKGKDVMDLVDKKTADPTDPEMSQYYDPKGTTASNTLLIAGVGVLAIFLLTRRK